MTSEELNHRFEQEFLKFGNALLSGTVQPIDAARVMFQAGIDTGMEWATGEPHLDGWPLHSGLPKPVDTPPQKD